MPRKSTTEQVHLAAEHVELTRRYFLRLGFAGAAGFGVGSVWAAERARAAELAEAIKLEFLTAPDKFGTVERGNPLPYTLPEEKRREVGLERETWQLEVVPDLESDAKVEQPLSRELGTALDWPGLMKLAEKHAVRFIKTMTCNNIGEPLGTGLWEGVPLREAVWLTQPVENIRRVFYYGYHNDDPKQLFQSSLPIGRVLEDPPGYQPVLLCYKLNGQFLSGKRGGPVRMLVPEAYGFKSVKWLQRVVLTNNYQANDTYAAGNNDIDSWMKTFARFLSPPTTAKAGQSVPITGMAQVGISGLSKVQVWLHSQHATLPPDDPYFTRADWKDADILPPPRASNPGQDVPQKPDAQAKEIRGQTFASASGLYDVHYTWGGDLPDGKLPAIPRQFDPATARPREWPLRYAMAHWATVLRDLTAGKYFLYCRTIDSNGIAQPLPRPFLKSGRNAIHRVPLVVEG